MSEALPIANCAARCVRRPTLRVGQEGFSSEAKARLHTQGNEHAVRADLPKPRQFQG